MENIFVENLKKDIDNMAGQKETSYDCIIIYKTDTGIKEEKFKINKKNPIKKFIEYVSNKIEI